MSEYLIEAAIIYLLAGGSFYVFAMARGQDLDVNEFTLFWRCCLLWPAMLPSLVRAIRGK